MGSSGVFLSRLGWHLAVLLASGGAVFLVACPPRDQLSPAGESVGVPGQPSPPGDLVYAPGPPSSPDELTAASIGVYQGRYALLVAVSRHQERRAWPQLDHDLPPLEETLHRLGFEVETVYDPDGYSLEDELDRWVGDHGAEERNCLLFFFAGHAHTDDGDAYLVPSDSLPPQAENFYSRTLSIDHIKRAAEAMKARHALFLFDASFSDAVFQEQPPPSPRPPSGFTLQKARQLIAADQAGQPRASRSTFVPLLLRALEGQADIDEDGFVTGTELGSWIFQQVPGSQTPQYAELSDPEVRGDFVFTLTKPPEQTVREMEEGFVEIVDNDRMSAADKVKAWHRFLETYPQGHPPSDRADELRKQAEIRLQFWELEAGQLLVGPEPVETEPVRPERETEPAPPKPPSPEPVRPVPAPQQRGGLGQERQLLKVPGSALLLKVIGKSDNIAIFEAPESSKKTAIMEPLKSYFVLADIGDSYRISSKQEEGGIEGYVAKKDVTAWNTREGLHFIPDVLRQERRAAVEAWVSEDQIRKFAVSLDPDFHGPDLGEELQTRVGSGGALPYPLLKKQKIDGKDGEKTIHQVLIPAIVPVSIETRLTPDQVREVVGAVTICVVFDASRSMRAYARNFAATLEQMLADFGSETRIAVGFIFFREPGPNSSRFEVFHPMAVEEAVDFLRQRVRDTFGGRASTEPEPVLDAMTSAEVSFLWNNRPAIRGASRLVVLIANEHAARVTLGVARNVPRGRTLEEVAWRLLQNHIRVFALQAGNEDRGNLVEVLRTLSTETGGEFYRSAVRREDIREQFAQELRAVLNRSISDGIAAAESIKLAEREDGGTVIPLNAITEEMQERLVRDASRFHIPDGGLIITEAWVFEQPELYREEILIEKQLLKDLVDFFKHLSESSFATRDFEESTASLLEALTGEELIGERLDPGVDMQKLVEKKLGTHFKTNLLSFPLEYLATLGTEKQKVLQENIRAATGGLAQFLEINQRRFEEESRIWMPVSYLP